MDAYRRFINRDLPREERSCTSKVPFATRDEARSYVRSGLRTAGSAVQAYRCPFGNHWHLGHRRRRHPLPADAAAPVACRPLRVDDGLTWIAREWWSDRRRRHLRPARADRPWREAWAVG